MCPVRAIGGSVVQNTAHGSNARTVLYSYWVGATKYDVTDVDIQTALKSTAGALDYPELVKGTPINWIDTYSLRGCGANALSLSGYSDRKIQKMG